MKKQINYEEQLNTICKDIQKSFTYKINTISSLKTKQCLRRIKKLNRQTNNQHIEELRYVIGRTKQSYNKYCRDNNYIPDPEVSKKIKETFIKLSRKTIKINTKKQNVLNKGTEIKIEYNSDRGSYLVSNYKNNNLTQVKEFKVQDIKKLGKKRKNVLNRLKHLNFGISIFDELEVNERDVYKINPDIVHIFLNEGKVDYAKMYIKEVLGGTTIHKPFEIKYVLNKDLKQGVFSYEENKNMKKMARLDRIANELVIVGKKKQKTIIKPKVTFARKIKQYINPNPVLEPEFAFDNAKIARIKNIKMKKNPTSIFAESIQVPKIINKKTNRIAANGNLCSNENDINIRKKAVGQYVNTHTGKIAAHGAR